MQEEPYFEKEKRTALYQYIFRCYSSRTLRKARSLMDDEAEAQAYAAFLLEKIYRMYCLKVDFQQLDDEADQIVGSRDGSYEAIAYFTDEIRKEHIGSASYEPALPQRETIVQQSGEAVISQPPQTPATSASQQSVAEDSMREISAMLDTLLRDLNTEHEKLRQTQGEIDLTMARAQQTRQGPQQRPAQGERFSRPQEQRETIAAAAQKSAPRYVQEPQTREQQRPQSAPQQRPQGQQRPQNAVQQEEKKAARTVEPFKKKWSMNWLLVLVLCVALTIVTWVVFGLLTVNGVVPGADLGYSWFNENIFKLF